MIGEGKLSGGYAPLVLASALGVAFYYIRQHQYGLQGGEILAKTGFFGPLDFKNVCPHSITVALDREMSPPPVPLTVDGRRPGGGHLEERRPHSEPQVVERRASRYRPLSEDEESCHPLFLRFIGCEWDPV